MRIFLQFYSPIPYFNLRPDFITVVLHNNLARLQLIVMILNHIRISDRSELAQIFNRYSMTARRI